MHPVWLQSTFPGFSSYDSPALTCNSGRMEDDERDRRSAGQWLRSVHAYLEFMAGTAWRRPSSPADRWSPDRLYYLDAIRFLNGLVRETAKPPARVTVTPKTAESIRIASLASRGNPALADELQRLRPELTMRKTLLHFPRVKLARMVLEAREKAEAAPAGSLERTA
jgi:hypothetical protein